MKRSVKRGLVGTITGLAIVTVGCWVAIHEIPGFGPWAADTARSVLGPGPIAFLEDVVYGAEDRVNLILRGNEKPKTFWVAPPPSVEASVTKSAAPPAITPPFPNVAAEGDGQWMDGGASGLWKTLIHPDPKRPFAAVAVVSADLRELEPKLVAGTDEPKSLHVLRVDRPGLIPEGDRKDAVAVFNGGFKAMHGNYGMRIGTHLFVPPRDIACTIASFDDGLSIATWTAIAPNESRAAWFRQTPPCLVENGAENPGLLHEFNRNWGATVGGDTIIRRSAIGISGDKRFLYYALGDATTAQSIGRAMLAIGAENAAQLDVNYSFPRFLVVERGGGTETLAQPLVPDIKWNPGDCLTQPAPRDFFYLKKKRREPS